MAVLETLTDFNRFTALDPQSIPLRAPSKDGMLLFDLTKETKPFYPPVPAVLSVEDDHSIVFRLGDKSLFQFARAGDEKPLFPCRVGRVTLCLLDIITASYELSIAVGQELIDTTGLDLPDIAYGLRKIAMHANCKL
jgi:hypothetical protein